MAQRHSHHDGRHIFLVPGSTAACRSITRLGPRLGSSVARPTNARLLGLRRADVDEALDIVDEGGWRGGMGLPSKPFWLVSGLASDGLPGQETGLLGAEPISTELEKPRSLKRLDALADPSVRSSTPNLFLPRVGRKPLRFKRQ